MQEWHRLVPIWTELSSEVTAMVSELQGTSVSVWRDRSTGHYCTWQRIAHGHGKSIDHPNADDVDWNKDMSVNTQPQQYIVC